MPVHFVGTCVSLKASDLEEYDATERDITYRTFARKVGRAVIDELHCWNSVPLKKDWHIKYGMGKWKGQPCVCMHHSAIHHIWLIG